MHTVLRLLAPVCASLALLLLLVPASLAQSSGVRWIRGGHIDKVPLTLVSPDGQTLVTMGSENTIKVWRTRSGAFVGVLKLAPEGDGQPFTVGAQNVAFDERGRLYTTEPPNRIHIWRLADLSLERTVELDGAVTAEYFVVRADGRYAGLSGRGQMIGIADLETGSVRVAAQPNASYESIVGLAFASDTGDLLFAAGSHTAPLLVVHHISADSAKTRGRESFDLPSGGSWVWISPNGKRIAALRLPNVLYSGDRNARGLADSVELPFRPRAVTLAHHGRFATAYASGQAVAVVDLVSWPTRISMLDTISLTELRPPLIAAAAADLPGPAFLGTELQGVYSVDAMHPGVVRPLTATNDRLEFLEFSQDGSTVVSYSDGMIRAHAAATGEPLQSIRQFPLRHWSTARGLLSVRNSTWEPPVPVIDYLKGDTLVAISKRGKVVGISPDGESAVAADGGRASIVSLRTGLEVSSFPVDWFSSLQGGLNELLHSPDSRWFVVRRGYSGPFGVYYDGEPRFVLDQRASRWWGGFTPSGRELITYREDTVYFTSTESQQTRASVVEGSPIRRLLVATDTTLVTLQRDSSIALRRFDLSIIGLYRDYPRSPSHLAVSRDGSSLAVRMNDGTLLVRSLEAVTSSVEEEIAAATYHEPIASVHLEASRLSVTTSVRRPLRASVIDVRGRTVWEGVLSREAGGSVVGNLTHPIQRGAYFVELRHAEGTTVRKAMVR